MKIGIKSVSPLLFALLLTLPERGHCQQLLHLGKPGKRRITFAVGDPLSLKLHDGELVEGNIQVLGEQYVYLHFRKIELSDVKKVILKDHYKRLQNTGRSTLLSSISIVVSDALNKVVRSEPPIDRGNIILGGTWAAIGLVMVQFRDKRVKIRPNKPLKVMDYGG